MKKLNQSGVAHLAAIILIVVLLAIGGVGYYVWQSDKEKPAQSANTSTTEETTTEEDEAGMKLLTAGGLIKIYDDENRLGPLLKEGDETKLKDKVPESFLTYMKKKLANNKAEEGCVLNYSISRVSDVNISGSVGPGNIETGDPDIELCGGGAAAYWYLKDGKWNEWATQAAETCKFIKSTTLYSEFVPQCIGTNNELEKNPNGSIKDVL